MRSKKLLKLVLLSIVFLTPLIGMVGDFGYEESKVLFFILAVTLAGILWIWQGRKINWLKINLSNVRVAGVIFISVLGVTAMLGINPEVSLIGKQPYFQGWILYLYLGLFFLMVSQTAISLQKWSVALTLSALVVAFLAIKDFLLINIWHVEVATYAGRVVSSFGQPNFYAGFLLLVLPLSLYLARFKNPVLSRLSVLSLACGILVS